MVHAGHTLLHDLKENVITPYVMVEALGWFFGLPLLGKTLLPRWYHTTSRWLKQLLMPSVATTLTVDKITPEETEEMIAAKQHALIREARTRTVWSRRRGSLSGARGEDPKQGDRPCGRGSAARRRTRCRSLRRLKKHFIENCASAIGSARGGFRSAQNVSRKRDSP